MIVTPATVLKRWRAEDASGFRVWNWGDTGGVAYNVVSGDTHRIDALGVELLRLIEEFPATTEALALSVSDGFIDAEEEWIRQTVESTLVAMQEVGLVASDTV